MFIGLMTFFVGFEKEARPSRLALWWSGLALWAIGSVLWIIPEVQWARESSEVGRLEKELEDACSGSVPGDPLLAGMS
jgi:hypothetical protein